MQKLFTDDGNGAIFSNCRKFRYALFRMWDINKPTIMFIGLNPSTANEHNNDPTIRRVIRFAQDWGYGAVYMMNLFPLVSTDPKALLDNTLFYGEELENNNQWLQKANDKSEEVIFAWGAFPGAQKRAQFVQEMFPGAKALIVNKDGTPRHPLYVRANTQPVYYYGYKSVIKI